MWVTLCIDDERAEWVHDSHGRDHRKAATAGTSAWSYYYVITIIMTITNIIIVIDVVIISVVMRFKKKERFINYDLQLIN